MIEIKTKGDLSKTKNKLKRLLRLGINSKLSEWGQLGVDALSRATPVDSGLAASSWEYRIIRDRNGPTIGWYNTNVENGAVVVILIQYGHGTGTGGYVRGRDYINPAMRPVFDKIADDVWRMVKS